MGLARFRVRTLLLAVAASALLIWALVMRERSWHYQYLAECYEELAICIESPDDPLAPDVKRKKSHYRRVSQLYRHAARYPWLRLRPNPGMVE